MLLLLSIPALAAGLEAERLDRWDLALEQRIAAATAEPGRFAGLAGLLDHLAATHAVDHRRRVRALTNPGGALAGTEAAALLDRALKAAGALLPGDRLAIGRAWLANHPEDGAAWRFTARELLTLERFAEAAEAFARADQLEPDGADGIDQAVALIRLGRFDDARQAIERHSEGRSLILRIAGALSRAGELGRARAALDGGLAQWPRDGDLLVAKGRLELAAGRPLRAIAPLKRAGERGAPSLTEAWLAAGKPVRAFESYQARSPVDPVWLANAMAAADAFGDHDAAERLGADFLESTPTSPRILRARANAAAAKGATSRAADLLRAGILLAPPDAADIDRLLSYVGPARAAAELADLRRALPWLRPLWRGQAEAARVAIPRLAWPALDLAATVEGDKAAAILTAALVDLPPALEGQRAALLARRAELTRSLADLDDARRLGLAEGDYFASRARLELASGQDAAAAADAWAWSLTRPDDGAALALLFEPRLAAILGPPLVFARLHDWVERDPAESARQLEALRRQAGPGGSPVLALAAALAVDRGDSDQPARAEAATLRRQVLDSLRAIGRLDDLDLAAGRVVLERPDGTRVEVSFHPVSGRLVRYAEGPAWIEARWDGAGTTLLGLSDAGGRLADDATAAAWATGDLTAVPELPGGDPTLDRLVAAEAKGGAPASLATARYLIAHLADRRAYLTQARLRLEAALDGALGPEAAGLWAQMAAAAWPAGLGPEAWARWSAIRAKAPEIEARAPQLPPSATAGRSWLGDPANWRLLPSDDDTPPPLALLLRRNGDLVVGDGGGLSVLRQGGWQRATFAAAAGRFVAEDPGAGPAVSLLAEDAGGVLWLVVGGDIVRLVGPYEGLAQRWRLPAPATGLAGFGSGVLVASANGLLRCGRDGFQALPSGMESLAAAPIRALATVVTGESEPVVLAATATGLTAWRRGGLHSLSERPVEAALWLPEQARLLMIADGVALAARWDGEGGAPAANAAAPEAQLRPIGRALGLATVIDDDGMPIAAVLGQHGLAFLRDGAAEARGLPAAAIAAAARRYAVFVATPAGLWLAEPGVVVK